MSAQLALL